MRLAGLPPVKCLVLMPNMAVAEEQVLAPHRRRMVAVLFLVLAAVVGRWATV